MLVALLAVALLAVVLLAYVRAALSQRRAGRRWSGWRLASFALGTGLVAVALSPAARTWAHHDLRGHMVQHLLLGMLAPLALVAAAPATLLLRALPVTSARRVGGMLRHRWVHRLVHPISALVLDTGALYGLYLTPVFALMQGSDVLHALVHAHFLVAGCLFAWAVAGPDPAPRRPPMRVRLAVLGIAIAAHSTLAKLMYAYEWPRGTSHGAGEIRDAAQLMYYGGDVAELLLLALLFGSWYRRARPPRRPGARPLARAAVAG